MNSIHLNTPSSHVLETIKQEIVPAFDRYSASMRMSSIKKADFFASYIQEDRLLRTIAMPVIYDLGCCIGSVTNEISRRIPDALVFGVDANRTMIHKAQKATPYDEWSSISNLMNPIGSIHQSLQQLAKPFHKKSINDKYEVYHPLFVIEDVLNFNCKPNSVNYLIMSAFWHELFSYGGNRFEIKNLIDFSNKAKTILAPNGKILIRDPAKPSNPHEKLLFTVDTNNGYNPSTIKEILSFPVSKLSTHSLLLRFLNEFIPAQREATSYGQFSQKNKHELPAWLVQEFLAHRGFAKNPEDWDSEIHEQYGVFSKEEMIQFAKDHQWDLEYIETSHDPTHRAAEYNDVSITTLNDSPIDLPIRFPNNFRAVLKKKE